MKWKNPHDALQWLQNHPALKKYRDSPETELGDRIELSRCLDYLEEVVRKSERSGK